MYKYFTINPWRTFYCFAGFCLVLAHRKGFLVISRTDWLKEVTDELNRLVRIANTIDFATMLLQSQTAQQIQVEKINVLKDIVQLQQKISVAEKKL